GSVIQLSGTQNIKNGAVVEVKGGGSIVVEGGSPAGQIDVKSGGSVLLESGALLVADGAIVLNNGGVLGNPTSVINMQGTATFSDLTVTGTGKVKLSPRSVTRVSELPPHQFSSIYWMPGASTQLIMQNVTSDPGQYSLLLPLHVPHGATLTSVS